jgi:hypothetical protein
VSDEDDYQATIYAHAAVPGGGYSGTPAPGTVLGAFLMRKKETIHKK